MSGSTNTELQSIKDNMAVKENEIRVSSVNILFLDISSSCTGYAIMNVNFEERKAKLVKAGAIWLSEKWPHQEKYNYMYHAISSYFWVVEKIDYIVVEQYSINPKKMAGVMAVPEMQGAIKAAAWENGVKVDSILPQSWRSTLKIKTMTDKNGKRDYKEPTKRKVLEFVQVPEQSISNISHGLRNTPSDLFDAVAISIAWLNRFKYNEDKVGIKDIDFSSVQFNSHVSVLGE